MHHFRLYGKNGQKSLCNILLRDFFGKIWYKKTGGDPFVTKISKNIKKLRQEKGLTQQALAEKIHITRQALSGWETGRTQPDLSMLEALSAALEVDIEQILYGEKRNTALDNTERSYKSTATVIISILGSLLTAAGLLLIFATGWEKLPLAVKGIFAFVPALLGQGAAAFVLFKKRKSVAFCEGVSLVWSAGVIATLALVNGIFSVHIGYENCLVLDALMLIPIMFMLDAVSPLILYYYMALHYSFFVFDLGMTTRLLIPVVLLAVGFVFVGIRKKVLGDVRFVYCEWISVAAAVFLTVTVSLGFESNLMLLLLTVCIALGLSDRKNSLASPYTWLCLLGVPTAGLLCTYYVYTYWSSDLSLPQVMIEYLFYIALFIVGAVIGRKTVHKNPVKIARLVCFCLIFLIIFIQSVLMYLAYFIAESVSDTDVVLHFEVGMSFTIAMLILIFVCGVLGIVQGAKENRLFPINTGFITICAVMLFVMLQLEAGLFLNGLVLLVMGAVLLSINLTVTKRKKKTLKAEVTADEKE